MTDPFDACCDTIRRGMTEAALAIHKTALFRSLTPAQQVEALITGMTVAVVGVGFSLLRQEAHDKLLKVIGDMLPAAAEQARAIASGEPDEY